MAIIPIDQCPHCFKENVAAFSVDEYESQAERDKYVLFLICPNCQNGICANIKLRSANIATPHSYPAGLIGSKHHSIEQIYPSPTPVDVPGHLPENIKSFYLQAANSMQNKHFDATAMLCGKIIEATLKNKAPDISGSLYKRIENLAELHLITPDLKKWAHEIRLIRNEAAYEIEPISEDDAKDILMYCEVFLTYIFSLPGMLKERRSKEQ